MVVTPFLRVCVVLISLLVVMSTRTGKLQGLLPSVSVNGSNTVGSALALSWVDRLPRLTAGRAPPPEAYRARDLLALKGSTSQACHSSFVGDVPSNDLERELRDYRQDADISESRSQCYLHSNNSVRSA